MNLLFRMPHATILLWLIGLLGSPADVQAQWTYTTNNGAITITRYSGPGGAVTIPGMLDGWPVATIGNHAFVYNSNVTSIDIGNSVTNIGSYVFYSCGSLSNVAIGTGLAGIGLDAFYGCTNLVAFTVNPMNPVYASVDGVLFNKTTTILVQCPPGKTGTYVISNTVTSIGEAAFTTCRRLSRIIIPESVTCIAAGGFYSCRGLNSMSIPSGVTNIGMYAFAHCDRLTNVSLPDRLLTISNSTFLQCTGLAVIAIPNRVVSLGDNAFQFCSSLVTVSIGNSVTNIGVAAFDSCSNLGTVNLPGSVTTLGESAFAYCSSLRSVCFKGNAPGYVGMFIFDGSTNATVYYLPDTTGWGAQFADVPAMLWNPRMQDIGVRTNRPGFAVAGTTNIPILIETSTNLSSGVWLALQTLNLTNGSYYFSDPQGTNNPARFYRIRSP